MLAVTASQPSQGTLLSDLTSIVIDGRCLLETGEEMSCQFEGFTRIEMRVVGPAGLEPGGLLTCYLDAVGIVFARIICPAMAGGWIVQPILNRDRKDSYEARIAWHAERAQEIAEQRAAPRIVPLQRSVTVHLGERLGFRGTIQNISMTGAAIALNRTCTPFVGSTIRVGSREATVVRLTADGIAVHFKTPIAALVFDERIVL